MTILFLEIGEILDGCVDCKLDQPFQTCKAGFTRNAIRVFKREGVRYSRSPLCIASTIPKDCRACLFRKVLLSNNWCRWFRTLEEAEKKCHLRGKRYWRPFTTENIRKDQLEEFEKLEDAETR